MPALGDILQLVVKGEYLGQNTVNVYFYEVFQQDNAQWFLLNLLEEIETRYQSSIMDGLNDFATVTELVIDNLTDGLGFEQLGVSLVGAQSGDPMPSFTCIAVKLNRQTKVTRNGAKRFAGVGETDVTGNQLTLAAPLITNIEEWCGGILSFPTLGGIPENLFLKNVIIGRTKDVNGIYQLDLSKVNFVPTATVKSNVSTQNSRKT